MLVCSCNLTQKVLLLHTFIYANKVFFSEGESLFAVETNKNKKSNIILGSQKGRRKRCIKVLFMLTTYFMISF